MLTFNISLVILMFFSYTQYFVYKVPFKLVHIHKKDTILTALKRKKNKLRVSTKFKLNLNILS